MLLIRINGNAYAPDEWYEEPCKDPDDPLNYLKGKELDDYLEEINEADIKRAYDNYLCDLYMEGE